jgi:hypothetical protein
MSTPEPHVDLAGLVGAELPNAEVTRAREHLAGCEECRHELADVVAGHALLSRSAVTLAADAAPRRVRTTQLEEGLPPLQDPAGPPRWGLPLLVLAATLVLVAGLGAVWWRSGGDVPAPPAAVERSATLEPVEGDGTGTVSMRSVPGEPSHMVIETSGLPEPRDGQYYYAWLLDPETDKMLPLGQVWPDGASAFDVDDSLIGSYSTVDVSLEQDDGDPQHSPISVLRASYA